MVGDAGNIRRLYWAVKTASEAQAEHLETLSELYLKKFGSATNQGKGKRGLKSTRSLEPHFSLARELDLLEQKEREKWRITFGPGRAFIALWEKWGKEPPTALLLGQLIRYDRSFLVPFILGLVESDYDFSRQKFVGLEEIARSVWKEIWSAGEAEIKRMEPPFPAPETVGKRTLGHHAHARVRLLNTNEGLGLNIDKLRRLAELFFEFQFAPLPSDYYFMIGEALTKTRPKEITGDELDLSVAKVYPVIQRAGYASGYGAFVIINELALPNRAIDWEAYSSHVRKRTWFSTTSSFRRDDFLFSLKKEATIPLKVE